MARKQLSALETVERNLAALSRDELVDLAATVGRLIAIADREDNREDPQEAGNSESVKAVAGGWVELKTVNGYGPYAYLRWRDGATLKSKYLGKPGEDEQ